MLTPADVATFRSLLGEGGVLTHAADLAGYNRDWYGDHHGGARCVLRRALPCSSVSGLTAYPLSL